MIALIDKPTIAQLKVDRPESFWHWFSALPESFEAELLIALLVAGLIGALVSWAIRWSTGEAHGLFHYAFKVSAKRTVAAVLAFLSIIFSEIALEIFITDSGEFVGWMNVMVNGFMAGSGSDAMINKGKRLEWSQQKRLETIPTKDPPSPLPPEPTPQPPTGLT